MLILGIESSCDETGVALYDSAAGLICHLLHSQVRLHEEYGGVVPELASRDHVRFLLPLVARALAMAGRSVKAVDALAYTAGPGLAGALLVGAGTASALAFALGVPALPVHHLEGHLLSPLLADVPPAFPFVALLVSGGHTQLMSVAAVGDYRLLGESLDDAAGEAFDKSAKAMGLGYPGGPALAALADHGSAGRFRLPRPMLTSENLDFSFSGLKTAVVHTLGQGVLDDKARADLAAEIQEAVVDVLVSKSVAAVAATGLRRLVVAGGVGANLRLRARLDAAARKFGFEVYYPPPIFCTDNGAMIALAGALRLKAGERSTNCGAFSVRPRWPLDTLTLPA